MTVPQLPSAVLWDMDGTLVDTEPFWFAAEIELVGRFGGTWTHEQAVALVGSGLRDGARVLQQHGVGMTVDEIVDWQTDFVTDRLVPPLPWRPGQSLDMPILYVAGEWFAVLLGIAFIGSLIMPNPRRHGYLDGDGTADVVHEVARVLADRPGGPVVTDPVMVATSGDRLIDADAVAAVLEIADELTSAPAGRSSAR